jgi:hypothetical protein
MTDPIYYNRALDQDIKQFLSNAKSIVSELKNDGYRISESCRFCLFIKELSEFIEKGFGLWERQFDITLLAEGIRDFTELRAIVKSKAIRQKSRKEIQQLFGGFVKPSDDNLTQSRDLQFELYLAAIFDLSGFYISVDEPDFTFKFEEVTYSIAAKRINSEKKIHARFSKAKKQIKTSGINGFIAFSLDRVVWDRMRKDAYIITDNPDALYEAGQTILHNMLKTKFKKAAWANRDPLVVGHIASLTIPAILPRIISFGFSSNQLFIPSFDLSEDSETYEHIKEIPKKIKWPIHKG